MPFLSRAVSLADEGNLRKLTFLRLMVATLVVGAAILVLQLGGDAGSVGILYGLLGAIYLSTASVYLAFRAGAPFGLIMWCEIVLDCAVITLILHFSGGSASYFAVLYVLPILLGATYFQVSGGILTAAIATAFYVAYNALEAGGYVIAAARGGAVPEAGSSVALLRCYLSMAVFILTGLLSGHLSNYVRKRGEELAVKEQELRRVRLNTDSIITNLSSGLVVANGAGEIMTCNPAALKILGIAPGSELEGTLVQDVVPHMGALAQELESAITTGSPRRRHELEVLRKDGTVLPLGISISILKGENGERRGVVAIFQDLTEVHRMREKVRRADKMAAVGELSTAIAHEIRAPLASICGSIEMLAAELRLSGDNRKLMDLVTKEADRLDRIITDFLEFARLRRPAFEPMDVEGCLDEVLLLLRHSSEVNRNVAVEVNSAAPHACIYADDEQIRQVFLNLIMNAFEAMADGGRLTIRIATVIKALREGGCPEECVAIDFENTGAAIPNDVIPHIFEPFFTTKEGGTGLGLAIVARIVESHFGHVRVESAAGSGTLFSVVFPVYSGAGAKHGELLQEEFISF
jgi:two-component system sensor histidine kinase PilS (NtrC family)